MEQETLFWQNHFNGMDAPIFPKSQSHPHKTSSDGHVDCKAIKLDKSSQKWSSDVVCQAALAVLLAEYTQASESLFGVMVPQLSNQDTRTNGSVASETAIPIRVSCGSGRRASELLDAIESHYAKRKMLGYVSLEKIRSSGDEGRAACEFQTVLSIINADHHSDRELQAQGLVQDTNQLANGVHRALYIACQFDTHSVVLSGDFDSHSIDSKQVSRFLQQLGSLIRQLCDFKNDLLVRDLHFVPENDLAEIEAWNSKELQTIDELIHDVIAKRAIEQPDKIAVSAWNGQWTYAELDRLSSQLASHIQSLEFDVGPVVPLCFEKSKFVVVAMLGVVKAGRAFTLLDPSFPFARIQQICHQSHATLALVSSTHLQTMKDAVADIIVVDEDIVQKIAIKDSKQKTTTAPQDIAYLIFTSGSTGEPKGSMIEHRGFVSCSQEFAPALGINKDTRALQFSSYAFGASLVEILTTLMSGGCVCIPSEGDRLDKLMHFINESKITWALFTPTMIGTMLPGEVASVRTILLVGEPMTPNIRDLWASKVQLINGYGQSETSTASSGTRVHPHTVDLNNIGHASGAHFWIVRVGDPDALAPIGGVGELLIESLGVARGYVSTRAPSEGNPFLAKAPIWYTGHGRNTRFYRTGDLARYKSDGSVLLLGRGDSQVKIRGQRVDLGEVESQIQRQLPAGSSNVVETILRSEDPTRSIVIAFLCRAKQESPETCDTVTEEPARLIGDDDSVSLIKRQLQKVLPLYYLPSYYMGLNRFPMTTTGKVDRRKLRAIATHLLDQATEISAADSMMEPSLTSKKANDFERLWASLLNVPCSPLNDLSNFFDLGGDSVTAIKIVNRARAVGWEVTTKMILQHPVLGELKGIIKHGSQSQDVIPSVALGAPVQQSFAQAGLWFQCQLNQKTWRYLVPKATRLKGSLDVSALEKAFAALMKRHAMLRTTFVEYGGVALQFVQPSMPCPLRVVEVPYNEESSQEELSHLEILKIEQTKPFDLTSELGWRVLLLRLGEHDHILSIVMHHIVADGWSVDILQHELSQFYAEALEKRDPLLRVQRIGTQYQDYSAWQRQEQWVAKYKHQLKYWSERLEMSSPAELMTDLPRPKALSGQASQIEFAIDGAVYNELQNFTRTLQVTPFVVLLAAFRATHYRFMGAEDATIGTPITNRGRVELEGIIGHFVNMQCIRTTVDDSVSFEVLVRQVAEATRTAEENADVPFEQIVSTVRPSSSSRERSTMPLVQIVFALHTQVDIRRTKLQNLEDQTLPTVPTSGFDIEAHFFEQAKSIDGQIVFSTDLFENATIRSMIAVFQEILRRGLAQPQTPIATIPLTDGFETLRNLRLLDIERTDYPRSSIVDVFREQVAAQPDTVAVKDKVMQLTYLDLDRQSDEVAWWLQQRDMAAETRIGVLAPRSCEAIVAFLGILKANLAYLPLDVNAPVARHEAILSKMNHTLVLVGNDTPTPKFKISNVQLVSIVSTIGPRCNHGNLNTTVAPSASSLAYTIFTSGSTGIPKGVNIEHGSVVKLVKNSSITDPLPHRPRVAHMANLAFDASVWEIWSALLNGGTLTCVDSATILDCSAMEALIAHEDLQAIFLTPAVLKLYLAHKKAMMQNLAALYIGGDRLDVNDALKVCKLVSGSVYNGYGPTENTVFSTMYRLIAGQSLSNGVPLGKAVRNSGAYVMDTKQRVVPVGVIGELVLSGDGLARGYADSALDKNRFIEVTIDGNHIRAYRTGDRVRWRPKDGLIEFFGRMDSQVKIRGYRIELSEVEYTMLKFVQDVAIVVRTTGEQEMEMIAFAVPREPMEGDTNHSAESLSDGETAQLTTWGETIRKRLEVYLPLYMVPTHIVMIEKMPLNASGKVDRDELTKRAATVSKVLECEAVNITAPRNTIEAALCEEFRAILGKETGAFSDFFELGGHSLMATKIAARISRRLSTQVSVKDIFNHPIIADLAGMIREDSNQHKPIPSLEYAGPITQSYAQSRLWFLEQLNQRQSLWYLMPITTRLNGRLDHKALNAALNALVQRHETLRTTFEDRDGVGFQIIHDYTFSELRTVNISSLNDISEAEFLRREQTTPFDLTSEPGWRVALLCISETEHVLSLVMHHIISDGWSVDVLGQELSQFYSAASRGEDPLSTIPKLPVQYRDFSAWQRQEDQMMYQEKQLAYWAEQLLDSSPAELLADRPRPAVLSGRAGTVWTTIADKLYQDLHAFSRSQQVTPFVVLLAAFRATHYRMTEVEDATIGIPIANRNRPELENLIGFFVNTQCVRITIGADDSFEKLVRQVAITMTAAHTHQDVPFERVVSTLLSGSRDTSRRDASRNPLVQLMFALHSQKALGKFQLEGLQTETMPMDPTTRLDVEFHLAEQTDGISGQIFFSTDLFEAKTMQCMVDIFQEVLRGGIADAQIPIAKLSLINNGWDRLRDLGLLDIKQTDYPRESSIVDVFREQVITAPSDAIAVKDKNMQLTYVELDQQSDEVAWWLQQCCNMVEPETLVGVLAPRSCETIVAFLGILKAHLAYLPLDINAPIARVEAIMSTIPGKKLLLLNSDMKSPIFETQDIKLARIREIREEIRAAKHEKRDLRIVSSPRATSIAYTIFTSGSTGRPKGVAVEHRSVVRLVDRESNLMASVPVYPRVTHITNLGFDVAVWEIYMAILNGGTLVCLDYDMLLDYEATELLIARERINVSILPPALVKQYLHVAPTLLEKLNTVLVAGDRFDGSDAATMRSRYNACVYNAYGPTENGVISTVYKISDEEYFANGTPIGRAISNSGVYVMDAQQCIVPVGVMGELVVTGDGLARGYTDPALEKDRFVVINVNGKRMRAYRTGDRVRCRPVDGMIEFFGRMDNQIKIRGHRIELSEIEYTMLRDPSVQDVAIVVRTLEGQDPELVAFFSSTLVNLTAQAQANRQIESWSDHFDNTVYKDIESISQTMLGNDFQGWTSMYDGSKIDEHEMREWLDDTIQTFLNGKVAGNVLEIGTGTGMVLFNLGKGLESYVGLEPSPSAVEFVNKAIASTPMLTNIAQVHIGTTADISQIKELHPEVVVVNSVAQYFPTPEYLIEVVDTLVRLEGVQHLFFGDIRSYAVNREFLAARALHNLGNKATKSELRQELAEIERNEGELLIDPVFFISIKRRFPDRVRHVEILPKRMRANNELNSYRYTAVLHLHNASPLVPPIHEIALDKWHDFKASAMTPGTLSQLLRMSQETPIVAVSNVPNSNIGFEQQILHFIDTTEDESDRQRLEDDTAWISTARSRAQDVVSMSVMDLVDIGKQAGFSTEISWARQITTHGGFDVVFHRPQTASATSRVLFEFPNDSKNGASDRQLTMLTNQPLRQLQGHQTATEVQKRLKEQLPSYMVPMQLIMLDRMPLNANGKVDRKDLARRAHGVARYTKVAVEYIAPHDQVEALLCEELSSTLAMDVSMTDNFFEIGGHSLMATKLAARLSRRLFTHVTVKDIFDNPVLSDLAHSIKCSIDDMGKTRGTTHSKALPNPLSLLPFPEPEVFISEHIQPQLEIEYERILDVYPTTSVQDTFLYDPATTRPRTAPIFFVDFPADAHFETLKEACSALVQHFDIFRTVFVNVSGRYYQVLLESPSVPMDTMKNCEDIDAETQALEDPAKHEPFQLGKSLLSFGIFEKKSSHIRVALRMSHALYDGVSLRHVTRSLHSLYYGQKLPKAPKFVQFVAHMLDSRAAGKDFWSSLLRHSSITAIQSSLPTDNRIRGIWEAGRVIETPPFKSNRAGFTHATVATTAYALTLAKYSGTQDVVFVRIVSGRQSLDVDTQDVLGPCTNAVPVRVRIDDGLSSVSLLRAVHDQYIQSLPFETMGFDYIRDNCTNWPKTNREYACGMNYLGFDIRPEVGTGYNRVRLDFFRPEEIQHELAMCDIALSVTPLPGEQHQVILMVDKQLCTKDKVEVMLDSFVEYMQALCVALSQPSQSNTDGFVA